MSKISLEPNSSGAGTFSIVSPDSNTNRTLNLPNASGNIIAADAQAWKDCRQALRDVPQQAGFPTVIDWPSKPE